ncbi:uncharacterized protein CXQ87_004180 [Candidozyma duobushaemuli]|uniref:Uncharacterized protein n=2 Tax=Candidozyma TaxID=3303203 RepID=A0ABX8IAZ3_9ASCO|nr:uncharacterized protein CXQ87_004180 [[Candida] duobushaemulonis]PVH16308.1 hypothetical protein CXQ87_004180 [[Candida] duobushaemulonis]QWU89028.1 hypothetical protein CA3LBN_003351 [[Candida] haemuloni]
MSRRQIDIDKDRATVLLLINTHLIKKAYQMYVSLLSNPPALQSLAPQGRQQVLEQYSNLNKRLQCNLSVLSYINDTYHNKAAAQQPNRLQFPVILSAPAELPELRQLYKRLQDLYPEALQFLKAKLQQIKQHQGMQRPGMVQLPPQNQQGPLQGGPMPQQSPYDQFAVPPNSDMNRARAQKPDQPQKPMNMPQSSFMGPPKDDFHAFNNNPNAPNGPGGPGGPGNGGFAGGFNENPDMPMNMSSISPQQILQQQQQQQQQQQNGGANEFSMDFY